MRYIGALELDTLEKFYYNLLATINFCKDTSKLNPGIVKKILISHKYNLTPSEVFFKFPNNSFTYSVVLKESHFVVHSYPEYNRIYVDLFSCKKKNLLFKSILHNIANVVNGKVSNVIIIKR